MDLLKDALSAGMGALEDVAGQPITIRRGNVSSDSVGVLGQSESTTQNAGGSNTVVGRTIDWLIREGHYQISGQMERPVMGDEIRTQCGRVFRVQGSGGVAWKWSDPRRTHYRIHTVEVAK